MGETVLSAFLQALFDKLSSPILKELGLLWGVKKELEKLQTSLLTIQDVLEDAGEKQVKEKAVKNWLRKLKDAAYDADDLLDEFKTEALRRKMANKVRNYGSLSNPLIFRFKMGHKIKELRDRLDEISKERFKYGLTVATDANKHPLETGEREPTGSFVIESEVYGRDEDKEKIVEFLIATGNQENLSIIPIVGMGGLGKTTLAQLAYNDQRVVGHFELRMWICLSDQFNYVMRLIQEILESATGAKFDLLNMDKLQCILHENLRGKKFLLVLDDIWSEDQDMCERSKKLLRCGAEGSKIIVTTRSQKVASIWGTIEPHHLKGLSDDDCWIVFKQRAFGVGREEGAKLVVIGKEIVKKCQGLPLAAKTLGSLMHFKRDENEWLSVKESEIWKISEETNGILPALRLSYSYLPSHLKQCFSYCSLIEKGYEYNKDKLIKEWMAHGFIQSCEVNKQMEDVGTEYFNDLVWRSFIEIVEKDNDGSTIQFRMHDLMIDLARSVAGDEFLCLEAISVKDIPTTTRHLVLDLGVKSPIPKLLCKANNLRTLGFVSYRKHINEAPENIFVGLRCLRVLYLSWMGIKSLPSSIGNLKHLRYLSLAETDIQVFPKAISTLLNLQTLDLSGCSHLMELPKHMSKMISLRHLEINGCDLLTHMPAKIGRLSCLQTLSMFVVCEEGGCSSIGELKSLNLRGELNMKKLKNVRNVIDSKEANLKEKHYLRKLRLSWDDDGEANSTGGVEKVIEGLQPHSNLKKLHIEDYGGMNFPSWMMDSSLQNLVEISLINCKKCQQLPSLGQLRFLKVLIVKKIDDVKCIDGTVGGILFPSLEELTLEMMPNLENWWGEEEAQVLIPHLAKLAIKTCPKLMILPSSPSLKRLDLQRSNSNIIKSVVNFNSLSFLAIGGFPDLTCLPIGFLPNLDKLIVWNCPKLTHLPVHLENMTSLTVLQIQSCSELLSIPKLNCLQELIFFGCENLVMNCLMEECTRGLTSLNTLSINECNNLKSFSQGIQHLKTLKRLDIVLCPELESLPEGLQHMTTLQSLRIKSCDKLASLPEWLGNLASLRLLWIYACPNVIFLPMELQCLTTLQELSIEECQHLERRCDKDTGEDWHKIAHVPNIFINGQKVS